jgi:hypothetical protein
MESYKARRLENIRRNAALVQDLGLQNLDSKVKEERPKQPPPKRGKLTAGPPTRSSARLANAPTRPSYNEDPEKDTSRAKSSRTPRQKPASPAGVERGAGQAPKVKDATPRPDLDTIRAGWTSWEPVAPEPTRDASGTYRFASYPEFTPNKSPEAIIREGSFGGSYWRPLYSKHLKTTVADDWRELPTAWTDGVDVAKYLTSTAYDPEANKYGVACGQSIEEWEAAGWIAHEFDVRGWFQWYCRFWLGRRCADDERQISRWKKCVGETGRWRRTLLKKYVQQGIRSVFDEGDDPGGEDAEVSPVVHQTCHHWAYEVRQEALDRFWEEGR